VVGCDEGEDHRDGEHPGPKKAPLVFTWGRLASGSVWMLSFDEFQSYAQV
jgi:hypothetical protein